jgi:thiol-disulfide isomerase/thioredoxin
VNLDVRQHPVLVLVFVMEGCPACEGYVPKFRQVAERHKTRAFAIDCNKQTKAADFYKISNTPTTLVLRHGFEIMRKEGELSTTEVENIFRFAERG